MRQAEDSLSKVGKMTGKPMSESAVAMSGLWQHFLHFMRSAKKPNKSSLHEKLFRCAGGGGGAKKMIAVGIPEGRGHVHKWLKLHS